MVRIYQKRSDACSSKKSSRPILEILEKRDLLANAGEPDTGFGAQGSAQTNGAVLTDFGGSAQAATVLTQSDNKIIAVGTLTSNSQNSFALARYNTDGSLDSTFGDGGQVTTSGFGTVGAATLQPDGKILVAGVNSQQAFVVARYTNVGALDVTFGVGGSVITPFGATNVAAGIAVQPADGKIVLAGYAPGMPPVSFSTTELVRYNSDGTLDVTFGTAGKATTTGGPLANALAIQSDGKIVVGGRGEATTTFPTDTSFYLKRFNPNGSVDSSFSGVVDLGYGPKGATDFALQPDQKIVAVGFAGGEHVLVRLNTDGTLDTSFGVNGKVFNEFGTSVALQSDGKIVIAGAVTIASPTVFATSEYLADGSPVSRFANGGVGKIGLTAPVVNDMAIDSFGSPVVAGSATASNGVREFAVARYRGGELGGHVGGPPNSQFVGQLYLDLLGRPIDIGGFQFWTGQLDSGQMTRFQVARAFETTGEYRNRVVEHLYRTLLRRGSDPAGLNHWSSFLTTGTAEQLESIFLGSDEYLALNNFGPNGFLAALYRDVLHRTLDDQGRATFQQALDNGIPRSNVAAAVLGSVESDQIEVQEGFHLSLIRAADPGGLSTFTDSLQHGITNEDFLATLFGSEEYLNRVQQIGP